MKVTMTFKLDYNFFVKYAEWKIYDFVKYLKKSLISIIFSTSNQSFLLLFLNCTNLYFHFEFEIQRKHDTRIKSEFRKENK